MAPARDDNINSYGGSGAGGKFRKPTSRRTTNSKPYDRPPTALRSQITGDGCGRSGWFSKLVDPAQRLISASAHRLFASVFRKRLTQPPPHPPQQQLHESPQQSEYCKEARDDQEDVVSSPKRTQITINGANHGIGNSGRSGAMELEQTLKQKTFTRSEIDRLTALLHSRTADMPSGREEERSEMTPSKLVISSEGRGRPQSTPAPVCENGVEGHLSLIPAVDQSVLDGDVVSPTELAKSYMGSRISKAPRLILGGASQASRDDTTLRSSRHISIKSQAMSSVPRSAGLASAADNGFITPRFRGRSAIYNMARTPYAHVNSRSTLKDAGTLVDIYARPPSSVSRSIWEQNKLSAPRQGSLKRRSAVLENDLGSVGPIRRIRQKPNLRVSRSPMQPVSVTSLSAPRFAAGADASRHLSSPVEKSPLSIEPKDKLSVGNRENGTPATDFTPVPTKSSEMASRILQQLDKLVPSKEKASPTKLSTSMLNGKALRSLEKVDSSRFMENLQDFRKDFSSSIFSPASHHSASKNLNKIEENGPRNLLGLPERGTSSANLLDGSVQAKGTALSNKSADTAAEKSDAYNPKDKRAFQISAPDESLDWDDDSHPNGVALSVPAEFERKPKVSDSDSSIVSTEGIIVGKPPGSSDIKTSATYNTGGTLAADMNAAFTFPSSLSTAAVASLSQQNITSNKDDLTIASHNEIPVSSFGDKVVTSAGPNAMSSTPIYSFGDKVSQPTESNVSPIYSFGSKVALVKDVNFASTVSSLDSKNVDKTSDLACSCPSTVPGQSVLVSGVLPTSKSGSSGGPDLVTTAGGVTAALEYEKSYQKSNNSKIHDTAVSWSAPPSTSAAGICSSGASANGSFANTCFSSSASPSNFTGQCASSSSVFAASVPVSPSTDHVNGLNAPSLTSSNSISSGLAVFSSAPAINFDSATVKSTTSSTMATIPSAESDDKTKNGTSFSNLSSSPFRATSLCAHTESSKFGLAPVTSSIPNNLSQGFTPLSSGFEVTNSSLTVQESSRSNGVVNSTPSIQSQFGLSAPSPSFGLVGKSALLSSNSLFCPSSGSTSGQTSLATPAEANSGGSGGSTTDMAATTLQSRKSPAFGSTLPSNGFTFGASSAATGSSNASPVVSRSSNSSPSLNSFISSTSSRPSTLAPPSFGNYPASPQPSSGKLSASSQPTLGNSLASSQSVFGISAASSESVFGISAASSQSVFGISAASSHTVFGISAAASQSVFGISGASSQPAFGSTSASPPAFGSTSASQPAFGNTSASQPAFGSALAASSQPAFGSALAASSQPGFGGTSAASSQPSFVFGGSSAASQPIFGGTSAASQPAFGNTSASSQPAFGNTSASSLPAFGNSSASSLSAFGNTSASSLSAFGNTLASSQSAFGNTSASSQSAFGNTSASSQSAFGNTSASSQSAFGNTSASSQSAFGNTSASSQSAFGNTSASSQSAFVNTLASSQPTFGNQSSGFPFGQASSGHIDQMSVEDSMAEDIVQTSAPAATTPVFSQQTIFPQQSGFVFGSTAPPGQSPFQFGSQQNMLTSQNPSPFQASGSLNFNGGGSFSLGSGGGDKSKRKIIKVKHRRK